MDAVSFLSKLLTMILLISDGLTQDEFADNPEFICGVESVVDTAAQYTLKFHGALESYPNFPELPFFEYKKSKRFVAARPRPYKEHQKRIKKRLQRLDDTKFLKSLEGLNEEQMLAALSL